MVVRFYRSLKFSAALPDGIEVMNPVSDPVSFSLFSEFYGKFFSDTKERVFLFGINPGRFGGGITGIPFTDPIKLEEECGIRNPFNKRPETSADFIYKMIAAWGGVKKFYSSFYITAISPLGFTRNGNNFNYYDDRELLERAEAFIVNSIKKQIAFPCRRKKAICIGTGKNLDHFNRLNEKHSFFEEIISLPHPRFIMQYRRRKLNDHIEEYIYVLKKALKESSVRNNK